MNNKNPKVNGTAFFLTVFESFMALVYIGVAYTLLATHIFDTFDKSFRLPLGIILGIYGLFRVYRAIKKLKSVKDEDEIK